MTDEKTLHILTHGRGHPAAFLESAARRAEELTRSAGNAERDLGKKLAAALPPLGAEDDSTAADPEEDSAEGEATEAKAPRRSKKRARAPE